LRVQLCIENIEAIQPGELLTVSGRVFDGGRLAVEGIAGLIVRGKRQSTEKKADPQPARQERFRVIIETQEGQQLRYAQASGDRNFIHTNGFWARCAGLPRTIMPGACVMALACNALTELLLHDDFERLASVSCAFSGMVFPGDRLTLIGFDGHRDNETGFELRNDSGRVVLKEGVFACA
jgi:acyl dehydratase